MKVAIGSDNPVKMQSVKLAFKLIWPQKKFEFQGIKVESGVSNQPMSDLETVKGAKNRAKKALKVLKADFGVGLEGGIHKVNNKWFDCGWVVVLGKDKKEGIGSSIRMHVPKKMMKYVKKGMELGEVDDLLFNVKNSKKEKGHFGLMTKGVITRKHGYTHAVISALIRFVNPHLFD